MEKRSGKINILYLSILLPIFIVLSIIFLTVPSPKVFTSSKEARIVDINEKIVKIEVDEGHGDIAYYELKNYKILRLEKGDIVYIKVHNNKARYAIRPMGILEIIGTILLIILLFIIPFMIVPIVIIIKLKLSILEAIPVISFFLGIFLLIIAEENKVSFCLIIGLLLVFIPPLAASVLARMEEKRKWKGR